MNAWMSECMTEWMKWMHAWHGWMHERMHAWMNAWLTAWNAWLNEWINECMNECMNEWMNEWMNAWMNESLNEMHEILEINAFRDVCGVWRFRAVVQVILYSYEKGECTGGSDSMTLKNQFKIFFYSRTNNFKIDKF